MPFKSSVRLCGYTVKVPKQKKNHKQHMNNSKILPQPRYAIAAA